MSFSDLYTSGTQKNNIAHFAAMANIATIDGRINDQERAILTKFADRLNITSELFKKITKYASGYGLNSINSKEERLEYLFDLFKVIFADHDIDSLRLERVFQRILGRLTNQEVKDKIDQVNYFSAYAFTNQYEFMAVMVEYLFESPSDFREFFPELYSHTRTLLNLKYAGY